MHFILFFSCLIVLAKTFSTVLNKHSESGHSYIFPDIKGKEKRKDKASSEGLLGVEAMEKEILIDAFKKSGVLNDEQYAAAYIKDAVNLKKYSVRQIRMKLMQKGIDRQVISTLTAKLDDFPQLYKLVETQMSKSPDKKYMEKFKRRLCGKGFSLWDINKVVGEFENES